MKNKLKILMTLALLLLISAGSAFAETQEPLKFFNEDGAVIIRYFGADSCIVCYETSKELDKQLHELKEAGIKVVFEKTDITEAGKDIEFLKLSGLYNVPDETLSLIPAVFIGNHYIYGKEDILEGLKGAALKTSVNKPEPEDFLNFSEKETTITFGWLAIFMGGFVDGVNPCSISMMLFFISFAMINKENGNVFLIGAFFALGTFISYLGLGIGFLKVMYLIDAVRGLSIVFYTALSVMSLYLIALNVNDFIAIKKGRYSNIKNQLSSKGKKRIHSIIKNNLNSKTIYFAAFFSALIISFFEFFCTGQIYLPMISYMISLDGGTISNYLMLILYNIAFILPIIIVSASLSVGKNVIDISQILVDKLHLIKLTGAVFFAIVLLQATLQLTKLI